MLFEQIVFHNSDQVEHGVCQGLPFLDYPQLVHGLQHLAEDGAGSDLLEVDALAVVEEPRLGEATRPTVVEGLRVIADYRIGKCTVLVELLDVGDVHSCLHVIEFN